MNIKKIIIGLMIAGIAWSADISYAGDRFERRQDRQTGRIYQGVKSGKISWHEYNRLKEEQKRIERAENHAWRDGRLTHRERERLDRMQDKADRHIYRSKHNNRVNHRRWKSNDCDRGNAGRPHHYKPMSNHHPPVIYRPGFTMIFSGY